MPKIIVSYDGTHNEDDAIALGRLFAQAGAQVALAYVRHAPDLPSGTEKARRDEAEAALARGAALFGDPNVARHVVTDPSTPHGLRTLAEQEGAEAIVFCSDSHTAPGHVTVGNSAQRLIDGGPIAVAIAPAGLAKRPDVRVATVAATHDDGDPSAETTARELASRVGADLVPLTEDHADLIVIGSRPEAQQGQVSLSATSEYLIEIARSAVLVVPRAVPVRFSATVSAA
jgi:nucleotide-binding universal stress UspA family protein